MLGLIGAFVLTAPAPALAAALEDPHPPLRDDPGPSDYGPIDLPSEERSLLPRRLAYRGTTLGFGGALHFDNACPSDGTLCPPESDRVLLLGTPTIDLLSEFGWRYVRAAVGVFAAPVPHENTDFFAGLLLGGQVGVLIGHERLRAGATVGAGLLGYQVLARLMATPWRDRRGHRHGLEAALGVENFRTFVMFNYRFAPAALNHVGGRSAARRRAEP